MTLVGCIYNFIYFFFFCYTGFRIGRFPPVVRTAVPVDGRFEHLVLSCNLTADHAIIWIERESEKALDVSSCLLPKLPVRLYYLGLG